MMNFLGLSSDCLLCGCSVAFNHRVSILSPYGQKQKNNTDSSNYKICAPCHAHLPLSKQTCLVCGLPSTNSMIPCGQCLKISPPYDRSISAFHYQSPISDFITQFKYSAKLELLPIMVDYLILAIEKSLNLESSAKIRKPDLLIPVPLFYKKRNKRGFNQSRLIAKALSNYFNIPISGSEIIRTKQTQTQASLDAIQRKRNLKNAFEITQNLPERIVIIDDIVTTGATVSELASVALKRGAKHIEIWSLARAFSI
ncbi:MAG: ComF family protein [Polaribacter sp.]|jgi:ComF family protein